MCIIGWILGDPVLFLVVFDFVVGVGRGRNCLCPRKHCGDLGVPQGELNVALTISDGNGQVVVDSKDSILLGMHFFKCKSAGDVERVKIYMYRP